MAKNAQNGNDPGAEVVRKKPQDNLKKEIIVAVLFFIAAAAGGIAVYMLTGSHSGCIFRNLTGLPCPGCGTGRSAIALLGGDFIRSWKYNPNILILLASLPCGIFLVRRKAPAVQRRILAASILIIILALYVLRLAFYCSRADFGMDGNPDALPGKVLIKTKK